MASKWMFIWMQRLIHDQSYIYAWGHYSYKCFVCSWVNMYFVVLTLPPHILKNQHKNPRWHHVYSFLYWIIAYVLLCLVLLTRLYKLGHIDRRPRSSLILSLMPLLQNVWARISIFQTWYFSGWCQITVHTVYYWQRPRVFLEQIPALRLWVNNLLMLMSQELQELGQSACG